MTLLDFQIFMSLSILTLFFEDIARRHAFFISCIILLLIIPRDLIVLLGFMFLLMQVYKFFGDKWMWIIAAAILLVEKSGIYVYGDNFKISGLSFFIITASILLSKQVVTHDLLRLSFFFPHVLAGPVIFEKKDLQSPRENRVISAMLLYALGLFLLEISTILTNRFEILVGDNNVNILFDGWWYLMTLYSNFFGYSLVALAYAWLIGFNISYNFNAPGLAVHPSDFWRRWHMSLSAFMRTYLFPFLRHYSPVKIAIALTLIISGFWHGLGAGYLIWSILFALFALVWPRSSTISGSKIYRSASAALFLISTFPAWLLLG